MVPERDEDVIDTSSVSESDDESGTPSGHQGSNTSKGEGRSLDNIKREFDRKQEKLESQVAALTEATEKLANLLLAAKGQAEDQEFNQGNRPSFVPTPARNRIPQHAAGDLSEFTDVQLQQALDSGQLSPNQARAVRDLLQERTFDSKFEQKFQAREKQTRRQQLREESEHAALVAFPALRDKNSEFYRKVSVALQQQRSIIGEVETDTFDVANRVARQMGVEVARVVTPGYVGRPGDEPEPKAEEPQGQTEEQIREIAASLRYALPIKLNPKTGKMERQKFNLKRIQERSKRYTENESVFKQGRKVRGSGSSQ